MNTTVADSHHLRHQWVALGVMLVFFAVAPYFIYPVFLMKVMCFALFACAFNLLIGLRHQGRGRSVRHASWLSGQRDAHFMIGMPNCGPGLTPSRQREVTVLMRV